MSTFCIEQIESRASGQAYYICKVFTKAIAQPQLFGYGPTAEDAKADCIRRVEASMAGLKQRLESMQRIMEALQ